MELMCFAKQYFNYKLPIICYQFNIMYQCFITLSSVRHSRIRPRTNVPGLPGWPGGLRSHIQGCTTVLLRYRPIPGLHQRIIPVLLRCRPIPGIHQRIIPVLLRCSHGLSRYNYDWSRMIMTEPRSAMVVLRMTPGLPRCI